MADVEMRVEIGFEGGVVVSMRLPADEWAKLEGALGGDAAGLVAVTAGDVTYHVDPRRICYLRHEQSVGRVGF